MKQGIAKGARVAAVRSSDSGINTYMMGIAFVGIAMSVVSMYAVIIVFFGLLPGFIALIIDQDHNRYISKIVLSFNSIGIIQPLLSMIKAEGSKSIALEIIIEPQTWLLIYIAASVGWIIYWVIPQVVVQAYNIKAQIKIQQLNFELDRLTMEWGDEIKSIDQ